MRSVRPQRARLLRIRLLPWCQQLTSDPVTRLYGSLAGGRKTQSLLLGFASQFYGRPQDRLLHGLVDEAFQNHATLNQQCQAYVVFFVSLQSASELQMVIRGLDFRCTFEQIVSPSTADLGLCYRVFREQLPGKLVQWGLSEDDLVLDYTGGTKSMPAALVLAPGRAGAALFLY